MFAVGTGQSDDKTGEYSNYQRELDAIASEPLDAHRFDVQDKSSMGLLLTHLTNSFCDTAAPLPDTPNIDLTNPDKPKFGGLGVPPKIDAGKATTYQVACSEMTPAVYVMVYTFPVDGGEQAAIEVSVSADVQKPTRYNSGLGGVFDDSDKEHKVIRFAPESCDQASSYASVAPA